MTLLADACPSCRCVHGQPTGWPVCPEHGHWMYVLRGPLAQKDTGWTYACQAPKCTYTHTQKEKATMTISNETTTGVLAIRDDQRFWDARQLAALTHLGIEDASRADLGVFFHRCQVTGLDPFANQICMIKRGGKWTIQTEIDGLRVIAHRAAAREGVTLSYGPTKWYDAAGHAHEIWTGDDNPSGASVTVYKDGKPFPGVARFKSFAARNRDGNLTGLWPTMGDHLIAKCAEAQALRKAFPHDLEAIITSDEAGRMPPPRIVAEAAPEFAGFTPDPRDIEPEEKQERPVPRIRRGDMDGLRQACSDQLSAVGIEDPAECENYLRKLANKAEGDLTEQELRFALDTLATCKDLEALVELCNPEPEAS